LLAELERSNEELRAACAALARQASWGRACASASRTASRVWVHRSSRRSARASAHVCLAASAASLELCPAVLAVHVRAVLGFPPNGGSPYYYPCAGRT